MALLDLLGQRCESVSPSVLNTRLGELRESGLVELLPSEGYAPTPLAAELGELLLPLDAFAKRWARRCPSQGR
jgi:DNA-binding HxlR family transcriptional regulator